jgi:hypothetical protein
MGRLDGDDVVCDAIIEEMLQAVFSASTLGALRSYISRPTKSVQWNGASSSKQLELKAADSWHWGIATRRSWPVKILSVP